MTMKKASVLILAAALAGCAGAPAVPAPAAPASYEHQAARVADRDPIEAFRLLRRGTEVEDAACALRFLAFTERRETTLSQREYARLFIERQLALGGLRSQASELRYRLALSWNFLEPRSPSKVRLNLEALAREGMSDEMADSPVVREMIRATGARVDPAAARRTRSGGDLVRACDAQGAELTAGMGQHAPGRSEGSGPNGPTVAIDVTAWGGGNDRLLQASGVLAFVVNPRGEPVFRGKSLWIHNGGDRTITWSAPAAGIPLRELRPGAEETVSLDPSEPVVSGIDLTVRYAWRR